MLIWIWLWINEISSVSLDSGVSLNSGVGGFDGSLGNINGLFFLLFLPLSGSLSEISISIGNFIDLNISLNIFLLWWWCVHKGSSLGDVSVLIIINASVLWVSASNIVLVIWVKSIVGSLHLVDLSEGISILLL